MDTFAGAGAWILMGVAVVIAFLVVFWRHIPLIIILSLFSAVGIFNVVHLEAIEKGKPFPAAISARFEPSEERLKEIEELRRVRLATIKKSYFDVLEYVYMSRMTTFLGEPAFPGSIVIVIRDPDNKSQPYTIRYRGKEAQTNYYGIKDIKFMRTDRAAFLLHECSLLAWAADNADTIKDIPGKERVTLTGNVSDDALTLEVTHNGDTGWIRRENLKM
jgi:hypothetical protein